MFTGIHALRAADLFDFIEAYDLHFQTIRAASPLTRGCLVAFHFVIDLFLLRCLITWFLRDSRHSYSDRNNRIVAKIGGFTGWVFLTGLLLGAVFGWIYGVKYATGLLFSGISPFGLAYLLGALCMLVVGWEFYARAKAVTG